MSSHHLQDLQLRPKHPAPRTVSCILGPTHCAQSTSPTVKVLPESHICTGCLAAYHLWRLRDLQHHIRGLTDRVLMQGLTWRGTEDQRLFPNKQPCVADNHLTEKMFDWLPAVWDALKRANATSRCERMPLKAQVCPRCAELVVNAFPDTHKELITGYDVLFPCIVQLEVYQDAAWRFWIGRSEKCERVAIHPHALCKGCAEAMMESKSVPNWEVYFDEFFVVRSKRRGERRLMDDYV